MGESLFVVDIVVALAVAAVCVLVFIPLIVRRGSEVALPISALALFILAFTASWAGGLWFAPVGPVVAGTYWATFLAAGLAFALLLGALVPRRERPALRRAPRRELGDRREGALAGAGLLYWTLIGVLLIAVLLAYLRG